MTLHDGLLRPEDEAGVVEVLTRALHTPEDHVDVSALVAGTRRGIVRAKTRRRVGVAATALTVAGALFAVPATVGALGAGGGSRATAPAAGGSAAPSSRVAQSAPGVAGLPQGTTLEKPTVVPIGSLPRDPNPNHVAYLVPDAVSLKQTDFARPMGFHSALPEYRWTATVNGQECTSGATSPMPVTSRQWLWGETETATTGVDVIVSGWKPGTTRARFADIRQNDGACHFLYRQRPYSTAGLPGNESWAATSTAGGLKAGRAAVRVGDVIVSVEVIDARSTTTAVKLAKRLAKIVAGRVVSSGLSKTAAHGG